jgi:hypothetical protein
MDARRNGKHAKSMFLPELKLSSNQLENGRWPVYIEVKRSSWLGDKTATFVTTDLVTMKGLDEIYFASDVTLLDALEIPYEVISE